MSRDRKRLWVQVIFSRKLLLFHGIFTYHRMRTHREVPLSSIAMS